MGRTVWLSGGRRRRGCCQPSLARAMPPTTRPLEPLVGRHTPSLLKYCQLPIHFDIVCSHGECLSRCKNTSGRPLTSIAFPPTLSFTLSSQAQRARGAAHSRNTTAAPHLTTSLHYPPLLPHARAAIYRPMTQSHPHFHGPVATTYTSNGVAERRGKVARRLPLQAT